MHRMMSAESPCSKVAIHCSKGQWDSFMYSTKHGQCFMPLTREQPSRRIFDNPNSTDQCTDALPGWDELEPVSMYRNESVIMFRTTYQDLLDEGQFWEWSSRSWANWSDQKYQTSTMCTILPLICHNTSHRMYMLASRVSCPYQILAVSACSATCQDWCYCCDCTIQTMTVLEDLSCL